MQKDGVKKLWSMVLISLTILGIGGATFSLINITIVFGSESAGNKYSDTQVASSEEEDGLHEIKMFQEELKTLKK